MQGIFTFSLIIPPAIHEFIQTWVHGLNRLEEVSELLLM